MVTVSIILIDTMNTKIAVAMSVYDAKIMILILNIRVGFRGEEL